MLVQVGDDDNSDSGFTINSIDYDDDQLTLSAQVTSQDNGAAVIPLPITPTTAGDVIPAIIGTVKIGTTTIYVTDCGFTVDQIRSQQITPFTTTDVPQLILEQRKP